VSFQQVGHPVRIEEPEVAKLQMSKNARLMPIGRERLVREVASGQTPRAIARAAGICRRTVRKWVTRCKAESLAGLARIVRRGPGICIGPVAPAVTPSASSRGGQREVATETAGVSQQAVMFSPVSRTGARAPLERVPI
jgi:hypothetical protein